MGRNDIILYFCEVMSLFRRKKDPAPLVAIAPDKFKGTLTAFEAAEVMRRALADILPSARVEVCPMADGGEGTARIIARHVGMKKESRFLPDPLGKIQEVEYFTDGSRVAVDSAAVIGLARIDPGRRNPMASSSYPLGLLVKEFTEEGIGSVIICIGGTATVDGGAGFLQALGARFFTVDGEELPSPLPAVRLGDIFSIDFNGMPRRLLRGILRGLADVDVPLEGSLDYAAQKGVQEEQMEFLRAGILNLSQAVDEALMPCREGGRFFGSGGGLGYALGRVIGCPVESGGKHILNLYDIFGGMERPELVITGEGCLDTQTTDGKVVWQLYSRAHELDIPVLALVGCNRFGEAPDGMAIEATETFLRGYELTMGRAIQTLDIAARQALAEICTRLWP